MKTTDDPSYTGTSVRVEYDLGANTITVSLPGYTEPAGDEVGATVISMTPAEAVELAGGITAAGVSAAAHLLAQRTAAAAGPVERVTDAGSTL